MKQNYTHIVLLIDRSGSMVTIKNDMEGGIKSFIDKQKLEDGQCTVTAAQFDTEYEILCSLKPIQDVDEIKIVPRGGTALIDSMSRFINEVGAELDLLSDDERPDRVLFITITDGEENASKECTNEQLTKLIKEQEEKYSWNFTYLGANQDAFGTASKFGGRVNNSMNYTTSKKGIDKMFDKLSAATTRYRGMEDVQAFSGQAFGFTDEEQKDLE
jgi:uncharacterized protein YegL